MFRLALIDCSLSDLGFEGDKFTWTNNREARDTVRCILDRVCANSNWTASYPEFLVEHLKYPGSDHIPLRFHVQRPPVAVGGNMRRPWRFEAQWMRRSECEEIIKEASDSQSANDRFERLFGGVEACQLGLRQLVGGSSDIPRIRISKLRAQIDEIQKGELTEQLKAEIANLRAELEHVYMDGELFWRQRCKNQWAQEGDRNTRFFHAKATKRKRNNLISGLQNSEGVWKERVVDIERIIQSYFGELFQTSNTSSAIIDEVLDAVSPAVT